MIQELAGKIVGNFLMATKKHRDEAKAEIAAILTEHLAVREGDDALILELIEERARQLSVSLDDLDEKEAKYFDECAAKLRALALRFSARAAREQKLREALEGCCEYGERDDVIEWFEHYAEMFYRETGIMAPGKSVPAEMAGLHPDEERRDVWDKWIKAKRQSIYRAACQALKDLP